MAISPPRLLRFTPMGRGSLAKVRWKNDRIKKKKARDKRVAAPKQTGQQASS